MVQWCKGARVQGGNGARGQYLSVVRINLKKDCYNGWNQKKY